MRIVLDTNILVRAAADKQGLAGRLLVVIADPDDDPIVQTAVLGGADFLCTRDAHLLQAAAVEYCAGRGIKITNDIDLYHVLTGRPIGGRAQQ